MDLLNAGIPYVGVSEALGTHKPIIDMYNGQANLPRGYRMKYTDSWCMAFVSVCALLAGNHYGFPYECSCGEAISLLMEKDMWQENDAYIPQRNDLIFYHWADNGKGDCTHWSNHVGIVAGVSNGEITVLEGNYNDTVQWRYIPVNYAKIRGFGMTSALYSNAVDYDLIANQVIAGKWGNNPERKERLLAAGYDYDAVQSMVNKKFDKQNDTENFYDIKHIALQVIRGEWGNNPERRKRLTEAGYDYEAIQERINQYYERGKVL